MVLILTLAVRSAAMEEMAMASQEAHGSCVVAAHMAKLEQAQSFAKHVIAEAAGRFKKFVKDRYLYCQAVLQANGFSDSYAGQCHLRCPRFSSAAR